MIAALLSLSLIASPLMGYAPVKAGGAPLEGELEQRAQKLGKTLRCATCQGLSVTDSPAPMARSQLDKIRELILQGKSDDEIHAYFVDRFGEWVLLEPPKQGWNWLVWAGPVVLLLGGAVVIGAQLKKSGANATAAASKSKDATPATPAVPTDDPYLRALREEMER